MKYQVNTNYLNIEAAAAIVKALTMYSGESVETELDLIKETLLQDEEPIDVSVRNFNEINQDTIALCNCIDW